MWAGAVQLSSQVPGLLGVSEMFFDLGYCWLCAEG